MPTPYLQNNLCVVDAAPRRRRAVPSTDAKNELCGGVLYFLPLWPLAAAGNTKRGKYHCTIDLLFDWFGLACFANKNKNSCHTADSKPVTQEVNGTVIFTPLVFPGLFY